MFSTSLGGIKDERRRSRQAGRTQYTLSKHSSAFPLSELTLSVLAPVWKSLPPHPGHLRDWGIWGAGLWEGGVQTLGRAADPGLSWEIPSLGQKHA